MENLLFPDWQMWTAILIIVAGIIAYASDKFSLEMVSAAIIIALMVFFHLFPVQGANGENILDARMLLSGFASPALFAIMGLLIIGQGMFQAGALEYPTRMLLTAYNKWRYLAIASVFLLVMIVSAFLNNTPVVVMFIPIMSAIAARSKVAPSKYMIPLSFMSIFGGMITIIGSSTNLLAAEAYTSVTGNEIGFFALAPIGLVLAGVGALYMFGTRSFLLPNREAQGVSGADGDGKQFIAQIEISRGHPLIGRGAVAGLFPDLPDVTVRMVQRREEAIVPPYDDFVFRLHDTVIVAATRKALTNLLRSKPDILAGVMSEVELKEESQTKGELTMVEAIVAPGSRMIGRTIAQIGFRYQTNCVILGIQRRSRMIRSQMNSIRLEAGDVLLLLGDMDDVRSLRTDRDIVLLEWSMQGLPDPSNAARAAIIFFGVIAASGLGLLPIAISAFLGATLMIASGCLNVRQASRAIDRRIFLLIGAALAMGMALERTGGAQMIAEQAVSLAETGGPIALISAFFIICAATTNVLSNNATAVLFTPIAVSAAQQAGIDPLVLVLTVIFGANCSFATPVAYQTNLLVMSPGHYQFKDYLVVGLPLILLMWIVFSFVAPYYFRMTGLL
ncbi:TRAP transporter large permease subunit [Parvularcula flava]|uniref:Sodium:sulfate symporter n=1 Tax=Aquisalinus luteolus TaxID=1566827 RepID=A0A8J3A1E9_9PROT|nr:SLC13 family permease [Aquisalinus luteolus]NHK27575.1 TRAP transporter large permease subunit [Aquisalinus luteolus]GGH95850.1 sodium:sulfate symporter [Aquisalinus luteolus]